jgi:ribosomal protein S6
MTTNKFYRKYAMFLVLSPNSNKESVGKIINDLQTMLESYEGMIETHENLGIKPLGYSIAKHNTGLILQIYFKLPDVRRSDFPANIQKTNKLLGLAKYINNLYVQFDYKRNPNILRSMIVTVSSFDKFNFQSLRQFQGFQATYND